MEGSHPHQAHFIPMATAGSASMFVVPFSRTGPLCRCQFLFVDYKGYTLLNWRTLRFDCNETPAQEWEIQRGSTKVRVAGQNFCLDAGSSKSNPPKYKVHTSEHPLGPANGVELKIWECFPNLPAQQWVYTNDNRIALQGQGMSTNQVLIDCYLNGRLGFCADLTNGDLSNGNPIQIWKCTDFDANQIWTQPTLLD